MSVSFDIENGELVLKHDGTADDLSTVEAIERIIRLNDPDFTPSAYSPGSADRGDREASDEEEGEDESPAERRARLRAERRRLAQAEASAAEGRRVAATSPFRETAQKREGTMTKDEMIETIHKSGCAIAILKRFVEDGKDSWTEFELTKILSDHWGKDFSKRYQAQDAEGLLARRAIERARNAAWAR